MSLEKLYTVDEIAEMVSVTTRTIRNYLRKGILKGKKIGGQWRFSKDDVIWMLNHEDAALELREKSQETVFEFLEGKYAAAYGNASVCLVADIRCSMDEAAELGEKICALWTQGAVEGGSFRYDYLGETGLARYTAVASAADAEKILELLNRSVTV